MTLRKAGIYAELDLACSLLEESSRRHALTTPPPPPQISRGKIRHFPIMDLDNLQE
jgi:hypothetical protein